MRKLFLKQNDIVGEFAMSVAAEGLHVGRDNIHIQLLNLVLRSHRPTCVDRYIDSYGYQVRSIQIILVVVIQADWGYWDTVT